MRLHEIGEFELIKRISKMRLYSSKDVIKGPGDDAAVIKYKKGQYLLFTTDMLIEGVHFKLSKAKPSLIGRKALAVNISDIAAMGGLPKYAVAAFGISPHYKISFIREIVAGMRRLANKFKVGIIGGDINKSRRLIISISLIGEVEKNNLILRSGANIGDIIFVTGTLGGSYNSGKHLKFIPRVKEARFLVGGFKINSMIDISDGLANDLKRIIEASGVGALLDEKAIPISKNYKIDNALFDGEDFELLFTTSKSEAKNILRRWPYASKITKIGRITASKNTIELVRKVGKKKITEQGFRHF